VQNRPRGGRLRRFVKPENDAGHRTFAAMPRTFTPEPVNAARLAGSLSA